MPFTTPLQTQPTDRTSWGRPIYQLVSPLRYSQVLVRHYGCSFDSFDLQIVMDKKFDTDMISAPWGLRWLAAWLLRGCESAVVLHDCLRRMPGMRNFLADAHFRNVLAEGDVALWRRVVVFYAVRLHAVTMGQTEKANQ